MRQDEQEAVLFFNEGTVQHATLGTLQGEEAVYEILGWKEGQFTLEMDQKSPTTSITRNWSGLLLTGAQRLDEADGDQQETTNLSTQNSNTITQEENIMAKKRSEILADSLAELLQESSDIHGMAIVGVDGLVYSANVPQKDMDEEMVGATSAAVLGLSKAQC